MKKTLAILLSAALLLSCFCMFVSASSKLEVSASKVEGERGDTVVVTLTVDNNPGFAALLINIPTVKGFEVVSCVNGNVMRQMSVGKNILWDSASNSTKTGTLLTITFRISEDAPAGDNYISVRVAECYNDDLNSVPVEMDKIKITVLGEVLPEDTTTETEETTTEIEETTTESEKITTETEEITTESEETTTETEETTTETEETATETEEATTEREEIPTETEESTEIEDSDCSHEETEISSENEEQASTEKAPSGADSNSNDESGCGSSMLGSAVLISVPFVFFAIKRKKNNVLYLCRATAKWRLK